MYRKLYKLVENPSLFKIFNSIPGNETFEKFIIINGEIVFTFQRALLVFHQDKIIRFFNEKRKPPNRQK
jgi:catabolite regulation protein CreA